MPIKIKSVSNRISDSLHEFPNLSEESVENRWPTYCYFSLATEVDVPQFLMHSNRNIYRVVESVSRTNMKNNGMMHKIYVCDKTHRKNSNYVGNIIPVQIKFYRKYLPWRDVGNIFSQQKL